MARPIGDPDEEADAQPEGRSPTRLIRHLALDSALALVVMGGGQLLSLLLNALFARILGVAQYGDYSYTFAWMSVGLILSKVGLDTLVVRQCAIFVSRGDHAAAAGLVRTAHRISAISAVLVGGPLLWIASRVARDGTESLPSTLAVAALVLVCGAHAEIAAAALRGVKRGPMALLGDALVRPIVAASVLGLFLIRGHEGTAAVAMSAYLVGTLASALTSRTFLGRRLPAPGAADHGGARYWLRLSVPLMMANGMLALIYSVDVMMLGSLKGTAAAGQYGVASKLVLAVIFVMNGVQYIGAPLIAQAHAAGNRRDVRRIVRFLNCASLAAALPMSVSLYYFSREFLGLFGEGFVAASGALQLLAVMQLLNVLTGPGGMLLAMTGRQKVLGVLIGAAFALNVVLNLLLIPGLGLLGAAVSAVVAHTCWNVVAAIWIRRQLGLDCTLLDFLKRAEVRT